MSKQYMAKPILAVISMLCTSVGVSSCSEIQARRAVQKADKHYKAGDYAKAIELYEEALQNADLPTAHHNLAITASTAYSPALSSDVNTKYAELASQHFQAYLESHPKDQEIIEILTTFWLDSGQVEKALTYWKGELAKDPTSTRILGKLGRIERVAGNYEKALEWDYKQVEVTTDPKKKASVLVDIGQVQYRRLTKLKKDALLDADRIDVADSGLAALSQALELNPDNPKAHSLMATIYQFRGLAHQTSWAKLVDSASQRDHHLKRKALVDAAKAETAVNAPTETPQGKAPQDNASLSTEPEGKE